MKDAILNDILAAELEGLIDDVEPDNPDETDGGISHEDLGLCPVCGASADEGCDFDEPHPDFYW